MSRYYNQAPNTTFPPPSKRDGLSTMQPASSTLRHQLWSLLQPGNPALRSMSRFVAAWLICGCLFMLDAPRLATAAPRTAALPVKVLVLAVDYNPSENDYAVSLSIAGAEFISELQMSVEEEESGKRVPAASGALSVDRRTNLTVRIDGAALVDQTSYVIKFRGADQYGELIQRESEFNTDDDLTILGTGKFKHVLPPPPALAFDIVSVKVDYPAQQLVIDLDISNEDVVLVREYHGLVRDDDAGASVGDFRRALLSNEVLGNKQIVTELPAAIAQAAEPRAYSLILELVAEDGQSVRNEDPFPFKPGGAPQASTLDQVLLTLSNPGVLVAISIIVLTVIGYFFMQQLQKAREQALPPRPPVRRGTVAYPVDQAAQGAGVRLQIVQTADPGGASARTFTRFPCSIGREGCDLNLPGDPQLSRRHAEITLRGADLMLTDKGSRNGTYIDNMQLTPDIPTPLTGPTLVRFGTKTIIRVEPL